MHQNVCVRHALLRMSRTRAQIVLFFKMLIKQAQELYLTVTASHLFSPTSRKATREF